MKTVTIHTAKTTLSQLLARVEAGEEIILARGNEPIAKLVPFRPPPSKRVWGAAWSCRRRPGVFEPLPQQEPAAWE